MKWPQRIDNLEHGIVYNDEIFGMTQLKACTWITNQIKKKATLSYFDCCLCPKSFIQSIM